MVVYENFIFDGRELVRAYSDSGFLIRQDKSGDLYEEAVDPAEYHITYTETDIMDGEEDEIEE